MTNQGKREQEVRGKVIQYFTQKWNMIRTELKQKIISTPSKHAFKTYIV